MADLVLKREKEKLGILEAGFQLFRDRCLELAGRSDMDAEIAGLFCSTRRKTKP
jgi:hypothetical protein